MRHFEFLFWQNVIRLTAQKVCYSFEDEISSVKLS